MFIWAKLETRVGARRRAIGFARSFATFKGAELELTASKSKINIGDHSYKYNSASLMYVSM